MNKKISPAFIILVFAVSIFGLTAVQHVFAASTSTSTNIDNTSPNYTTHTAESWVQAYVGSATTDARSESSGTYPTNEGANVTFTATAHDDNADQYYLIVCDSEGVIPNNNAAPSCLSQNNTYCVSTATNSDSEASCSKDTTGLTNETYAWYAYVCDHNSASACSAKSSTSHAGANAEKNGSPTGSPFHVNHIPTFTPATITNNLENLTIAPGNTLRFYNSVDSDTDSDGGKDTLTLYICSGESSQGGVTTAFDYRSNTCTGGTLLCSQAGVGEFDQAWCDDTQNIISIPTAHATDYTVQYFLEDSHDYGTAVQSNDYAVVDVDPVITGWTTTDSIEGTIPAGGSDVIDYAVALSDDNGDQDVTNVEGRFFNSTGTTNACTADENNCYIQASCTLGAVSGASSGKTAMGTDKDLTATCAATVWFNADASADWEFHVNPTDSAVVKTGLADTNVNKVVSALTAIGVTEASIAYGTIAVGGDSSFGATTQTALENQGNQVLDVLVAGTNMTAGSYTIAAAQQKWNHTNADFDWSSGGGVALVTSATAGSGDTDGCLNRDIAVRASHGSGAGSNESIAWKIRIPATQESGAYTGTNTFSTAVSTSCTGTLN